MGRSLICIIVVCNDLKMHCLHLLQLHEHFSVQAKLYFRDSGIMHFATHIMTIVITLL